MFKINVLHKTESLSMVVSHINIVVNQTTNIKYYG